MNNKNYYNDIKSGSGIYSIICTGCYKNYIGVTSRSIKKCIYEHIWDFKIGNESKT